MEMLAMRVLLKRLVVHDEEFAYCDHRWRIRDNSSTSNATPSHARGFLQASYKK
jgi:hypothetical protein